MRTRPPGPPRTPIIDRFWQKVLIPQLPECCWEWQGALTEGYGCITTGKKRFIAHRFAYELLVGPIPDGLTVDHLCRVRHCVNPSHLEPVTRGENTMRGLTIPAFYKAQTHCKRGHELVHPNLVMATWLKYGQRKCKACGAEKDRRRSQAKKVMGDG